MTAVATRRIQISAGFGSFLGREVVLVAIERDGALLVPSGDLRLLAGDLVSIFATPAARPQVDATLDAPGIGSIPESGDVLITAVGASDR